MDTEAEGRSSPPAGDNQEIGSPPKPGGAGPARALLLVAVGLTVLASVLLFFEVPTVQKLPFWFWPLRDKKMMGVVLTAAAAACLPYLVCLAGGAAKQTRRRLATLLVVFAIWGFTLQHALSYAERKSLDGMRARVILSGHGEFARLASQQLNPWRVLSDYETLVAGKGHDFARSKPPGQLLVYVALASVADALLPGTRAPRVRGVVNDTHWRLATLASFLLPLLGCLALLPLLALARQWLARGDAPVAGLLFLLSPPLVLVTVHLDQALYPLLATSLLWAATWAGRADNTRAMALRGVVLGAAVWCSLLVSFTLLPVLLIAGGLWLGMAWQSTARRRRTMLLTAAVTTGAFATLLALFRWIAGYDIFARFFGVMAQHQAWRRWDSDAQAWTTWEWSLENVVGSACSTLTELGYWLGPPMVLLVSLGLARAVSHLKARRAGPVDWFTLAWIGTILATALLGSTRAEVARLWIFFIPGLCIIAASVAAPWFRQPRQSHGHLLVMTQFAWVLMLKAFQDF